MPRSKLFLPMCLEEMRARGWDALDVLLVSGDAYVDHPAFGVAMLGRWLEAHGFRVGIVAQPRWDATDDVARMGRPRLFAGVTAGALDSMLAHYTAFRKKRHDDAYTPGGEAGARPNRACIVYANLVKKAFPGLPIVLGGVEASLRRASHYDFWSDSPRRSILLDAKADLLVYGMGERAAPAIAEARAAAQRRGEEESGEKGGVGKPSHVAALRGIPGTAFAVSASDGAWPPAGATIRRLPPHEEMVAEPRLLLKATAEIERQVQDGSSWAVQEVGDRRVVFCPPAAPLSTAELDLIYALPFQRRPHPSYEKPIPAMEMIQFSVTTHRGCAGGCSFCSLASHQGRRIASRSEKSIEREVESFVEHPDFRGSVTDVGGPSANMWGARCVADPDRCKRESCLYPNICKHFETAQGDLAALLRRLARVPGVRHVRVASGIRHDLAAREPGYARALVREFVGGQLKLAPEHLCDAVLDLMRKPSFRSFEEFLTVVECESGHARREQYVVPYLMSAFPGCTDADMRRLAEWLRRRGWKPKQVQCFIPIPGTIAAAMFWSGLDPRGRAIPVARTDAARLRQHHILLADAPQRRPPRSSRHVSRESAGKRKPGKPRRG